MGKLSFLYLFVDPTVPRAHDTMLDISKDGSPFVDVKFSLKTEHTFTKFSKRSEDRNDILPK